MNKLKQHLLQACINHGSIKANTLRIILSDLCKQYDENEPKSDAEIKQLIDEIDGEIQQFGQNLKFIKHPLISEEFLVFAIMQIDPACKYMPQYTENEKHFFNNLLEAAINNLDDGVEFDEGYRLVDTQQQISKQRVKQLQDLWLSQGYFVAKDDKIYLGPRAMVEYDSYWQHNYPDCISICSLCYRNVYWGIKCLECETKLHRECIRTYLIKNSNCPKCDKLWETPLS